jgi:hypothetical protein
MEYTKGELNLVMTDISDDTSVRFSLGGEELEAIEVDPHDPMEDVWIKLIPKGEDPNAEFYVGRHRKP